MMKKMEKIFLILAIFAASLTLILSGFVSRKIRTICSSE